MYIYHALINALSAHMIHINLNVIFYTVTPVSMLGRCTASGKLLNEAAIEWTCGQL